MEEYELLIRIFKKHNRQAGKQKIEIPNLQGHQNHATSAISILHNGNQPKIYLQNVCRFK